VTGYDGDPRVLVPDVLRRLRRRERLMSWYFYAKRRAEGTYGLPDKDVRAELRLHPTYEAATRACLRAVRAGVRNYPLTALYPALAVTAGTIALVIASPSWWTAAAVAVALAGAAWAAARLAQRVRTVTGWCTATFASPDTLLRAQGSAAAEARSGYDREFGDEMPSRPQWDPTRHGPDGR
jgi:hypothetical protein